MRVYRQYSIDVGKCGPADVAAKLEALGLQPQLERKSGPRRSPKYQLRDVPQLILDAPAEGIYDPEVPTGKSHVPPAGGIAIRELYEGGTKVVAVTSEPAPGRTQEAIPALFDAAAEFLNGVGTPTFVELFVAWSRAAKAAFRTLQEPSFSPYEYFPEAVLAKVELERLQPDSHPIGDVKADILSALEPLGFRLQREKVSIVSERYIIYRLVKRTALDNFIYLSVDPDPLSKWVMADGQLRVTAYVKLLGAGWGETHKLYVAKTGVGTSQDLVVNNNGEWQTVLRNIVVQLREIEATIMPKFEGGYGPGVAWFEDIC